MLANSLFVTTIIFLALLLFILGECTFLIPYRVLPVSYTHLTLPTNREV